MFFQEGPVETLNYMLLGFGVILGIVSLFVLSLLSRFRKLRKDYALLKEFDEAAPS